MGLAKGLEKPGDLETFDQDLMRAFMLFTNDLDITRGQSFRSAHDELLQLITDAGFKWINETCYASLMTDTQIEIIENKLLNLAIDGSDREAARHYTNLSLSRISWERTRSPEHRQNFVHQAQDADAWLARQNRF
jgi:hypothetical protein